MKMRRQHRWKKHTVQEQKEIAFRWMGRVFWIVFPVIGAAAIAGTCLGTPDNRLFGAIDSDMCVPDFREKIDRNLSAQMPFRDFLVSAVTDSISAAGGKQVGDVYLANDRLLERPESLDEDALSETASQLNLFYATYQIPMMVAAVPSVGEFYAADLLEGISYPSQLPEIDTFYGKINSAVRKIDIYHVLFTGTDDYIYNRTDPRWTGYGAYCVYRNMIRKMGFAPISYDQYSVTHAKSYRGSLYDACLYQKVTPDILEIYQCSSGAEVTSLTAYNSDGTTEERQMYTWEDSSDPYAFYLGEDCEKLSLKTNVENQKKLLLLKDSYADCMVPFLMQHYSEICILDVTKLKHSVPELTDVSEYSQILVLCDADTYGRQKIFQNLLTDSKN